MELLIIVIGLLLIATFCVLIWLCRTPDQPVRGLLPDKKRKKT